MKAPLDALHDFVQPAPPAWTPQTPAWYALFALIALVLLWFAVRLVRRWIADKYRREALKEVATIAPEQISALLKRTALAAWPRDKVASLSGEEWIGFLNRATDQKLFEQAPANRVEEIALHPMEVSGEDVTAMREATEKWIRRHRVQA